MKINNKSVLFMIIFFVGILFLTGTALSQEPCQPEQCTVTAKRDVFDIAIMPDYQGGPFPIEVSGSGYCGDTVENCLMWRYQCIGTDCNNIGKVWYQIPACCKNPIEVLWTSVGDPAALFATCEDDNDPGLTCDGTSLRHTPVAGGDGELFWFTTPRGIDYNIIDVHAQVGGEVLPCKKAIGGPGCSEPLPDVRVEPVTQCYQFIAENQADCPNGVKSTWLAKWYESNPCAIEVYAAYGDEWDCSNIEHPDNFIPGLVSDDFKIETAPGVYKTLAEYRVSNAQCNTGWFQFVDDDGCNVRCYKVNGVRFCK